MARGSFFRSEIEGKRTTGRRSKALGPQKNPKKSVSIKNQIRSVERFLRKDLPKDVRQAQEEKLQELQQLQDNQIRSALDHKNNLKDKRIRFFERRKIERMIKRLEKQCSSSDRASKEETLDQLSKLREDLNYVRFFPKNERYVSLLVGGDNPKIVEKRNQLRDQIRANLVEAASNGEDLKEINENDALDVNEDDFFLDECSSDEGDCDPADNNARKLTSTASVKEKSVRFTGSKNQEVPARVLSPPRQPLSSRRNYQETAVASRSSNGFIRRNNASSKSSKLVDEVKAQHSILNSSSEVRKPRRKRRPKKKKQA